MSLFAVITRTVGVSALAAALVPAEPLVGQVLFTESAVAAGIGGETYTTNTNHALGVIWIDFDNDGWPDLFATNGINSSPHLYKNETGGLFSNADALLPALPNIEMMGAAFADYDNDGDSDIHIFTDNEQLFLGNPMNPTLGPPNILLKNLWVENGNQILEGQPLFEDVTVPGRDETARCVEDRRRAACGKQPARP